MATATLEAPLANPPVAEPIAVSVTNGDETVTVPEWVRDLASFRRWVQSPEVPEKARIQYLAGEVWIDISKEQVFTHLRVKHKMTFALEAFVEDNKLGAIFPD